LETNFAKKTNEAEILREELKKAEIAQASGQDLLSKLEDEKVRWSKESDKLKVEVELMPKNAVITSCFVTYLSQSP
jgi:predicted nuclease with TOPRIM domain